ncbi:hypothetical protein THIAE_04340 [Thiomicrospira aerophila AL3]|uniref:Uncharacterized protein n=1 Tax=Thiomicrospira aerophila AL3 TaxID=717772 RepID=W0DYA4_9GAMM|nr:hypothetical protein [Thiomicrospira aerophila]AHF02233.1 hypothetical protein THIAE_04340 [Thiomicrospira aerophila AL3]
MTLPDILTFLGLLIAAYGATQDYIRLKFRLASKFLLIALLVSFLLLYVSTWQALEDVLKETCSISCYMHGFLWESRHFILVTLNLVLLWWLYRSLKLRGTNVKQFTDLVKELKSESNQVMLAKLINENVPTLLDLWFGETKRNQLDAEFVRELFDLTVDDKRFAQSVQKNNEQLGIEILKILAKKDVFATEFSNAFLISALKDPHSYVYSKLVEGRTSEITDLLLKHQHYEKFDLGLNLCWAILELVEENSTLMAQRFYEGQEPETFKTINGLISTLARLDPIQAHLSNLPYYIQKEWLKFVRLDSEEDETIAFELMVRFYDAIADLQARAKGEALRFDYLNYIYSTLPNDEMISRAKAIRLGCPYINLIFNERNTGFIENSFKQFKELFESYEYTLDRNKENLKQMFLVLLDKQRGRGDCEDWIHLTNSGNKKKNETWDQMIAFLNNGNKHG